MKLRSPRNVAVAAALLAGSLAASGCATTHTGGLSARKEPSVVLCTSARRSDGGIRIVGQVDPGIYPVTKTAIEYRVAEAGDPPPVSPDPNAKRYLLAGSHVESVSYRKGSRELSYDVAADAARALSGKVIWYRWLYEYDKNGSLHAEETAVHRTSIEEAGLPRAADRPGPDASVGLPTAHKH